MSFKALAGLLLQRTAIRLLSAAKVPGNLSALEKVFAERRRELEQERRRRKFWQCVAAALLAAFLLTLFLYARVLWPARVP
jgi:hypothetical protein